MNEQLEKQIFKQIQGCLASLAGGSGHLASYSMNRGTFKIIRTIELPGSLTKYFFEAYASGKYILGDLWNAAIRKFVTNVVNNLGYPGHSWSTAARYHHIHKMLPF